MPGRAEIWYQETALAFVVERKLYGRYITGTCRSSRLRVHLADIAVAIHVDVLPWISHCGRLGRGIRRVGIGFLVAVHRHALCRFRALRNWYWVVSSVVMSCPCRHRRDRRAGAGCLVFHRSDRLPGVPRCWQVRRSVNTHWSARRISTLPLKTLVATLLSRHCRPAHGGAGRSIRCLADGRLSESFDGVVAKAGIRSRVLAGVLAWRGAWPCLTFMVIIRWPGRAATGELVRTEHPS